MDELTAASPSAAACLADDRPARCLHLTSFPRLRQRFRSATLLERSLEAGRRQTQVIGRFPGERRCLSRCWAVLDLVLAGARGLGLSDLDDRQIVQLHIARPQRADTRTTIAYTGPLALPPELRRPFSSRFGMPPERPLVA